MQGDRITRDEGRCPVSLAFQESCSPYVGIILSEHVNSKGQNVRLNMFLVACCSVLPSAVPLCSVKAMMALVAMVGHLTVKLRGTHCCSTNVKADTSLEN